MAQKAPMNYSSVTEYANIQFLCTSQQCVRVKCSNAKAPQSDRKANQSSPAVLVNREEQSVPK